MLLLSDPFLAAPQVLALNVLEPTSLLAWAGALAVLVVLFAETGLLIGFFLPGDSLLFTAGLFCSTAAGAAVHLRLGWVLPAAAVGALAGAQVRNVIGRRAGPALLAGDRPRLAAGMRGAQELLDRYGYGKAIVLARFIPVVRTVLNPLAGVIAVSGRVFAVWQVVGGLVWAVGVTLAGYGLGSVVPNVDRYLLPVIAAVVVVSLIPLGLELSRARAARPARPVPTRTHAEMCGLIDMNRSAVEDTPGFVVVVAGLLRYRRALMRVVTALNRTRLRPLLSARPLTPPTVPAAAQARVDNLWAGDVAW